jgi:predicted DsbA family dithiol-disulfide isomerase
VRAQATDVPTTVADGRAIVVGSVAEDAYVEAIVGAAG